MLGFLKMTRSFPKIPEEVRSLPKKSDVFRRCPKASEDVQSLPKAKLSGKLEIVRNWYLSFNIHFKHGFRSLQWVWVNIFLEIVSSKTATTHILQSGVRNWPAGVSRREIEVFNPQAWDSRLRRESWQVYNRYLFDTFRKFWTWAKLKL